MIRASMGVVERALSVMSPKQSDHAYERVLARTPVWLLLSERRLEAHPDEAIPAMYLTEMYRTVCKVQGCGATAVAQVCDQCAMV